MNYLLEYLPEDYLKEMADYFAAQRPPLPPPRDARRQQRDAGARRVLVTKGDAAADIPACASCHGPHSRAWSRRSPACSGLRASYISAQLGAWRYGTRTAAAPDCMQIVAGI